jgi:hypothetical protein
MDDFGTEGRRLSIEIITTLVHIKSTMTELILKPAGISPDVYRPLLYKREETTGRIMSKRQIAPLILDAVMQTDGCDASIRRIIEIAAQWSSFHLANDEYAARATVQKARELLGTIELMEAREAKQRELARKEEISKMERERAEILQKQSDLLLMMFDDLAVSNDPHRRGFLLQDLLNRLFDLHQIPVTKSFTRNEGGEQIDGAFRMEGWHYLVECRWRKKFDDIRNLDGLQGQVGRSGRQVLGLYLSINGWSDNVPSLLKQNPYKSIILMDGYDLRVVLSRQADLRELILAKVTHLNLKSEPFLSANVFFDKLE